MPPWFVADALLVVNHVDLSYSCCSMFNPQILRFLKIIRFLKILTLDRQMRRQVQVLLVQFPILASPNSNSCAESSSSLMVNVPVVWFGKRYGLLKDHVRRVAVLFRGSIWYLVQFSLLQSSPMDDIDIYYIYIIIYIIYIIIYIIYIHIIYIYTLYTYTSIDLDSWSWAGVL